MASSTPPASSSLHAVNAEDGSSSLFASYERQYATASTTVATGLRQLNASLSSAASGTHAVDDPSRVVEKVRQLESQLKDAEMTLQRMDMEARSATPPSASLALVKKVKDYKRDHQTLLMDVRKAGKAGEAGKALSGLGTRGGAGDVENRAELGLSGYKTEAQQQRDRLLTATDRLEQTGERIREGRKQLLETEELGVAVLSDLQRQRESIMHSRETLGQVDANVGTARQVLAVMSRRMTQNKMIMYGVIAMLAGAILLLIYAKLT